MHRFHSPKPTEFQEILGLGTWVPKISFEMAKRHILPPLTGIDVKKTRQTLTENGSLENNALTGFDSVFKQIVSGCVFESRQKIRKPILEYISTGEDLPNCSSSLTEGSRPSAFGRLVRDHPDSSMFVTGNDNNSPYDWRDIGLAVEFLQRPSQDSRASTHENSSKILWSMQQMFAHDPRRRFTYGITFETQTRGQLWYCNRSVTLVTEPFDLLEDTETFLYAVLSLFYAPVLDLGWDPTIRLGWDNQFYYDITIYHLEQTNWMIEKTYRTVGVLADQTTGRLHGPGTRVFEAYPIDALGRRCGQNVVIKDRWTRDGMQSEEDILIDILKQVSDEDKCHFLTLVMWGDVLVNGTSDHTEATIMRGLKVDRDSPVMDKKFYLVPNLGAVTPHRPHPSSRSHLFEGKTHRRTVYKEIGTPFRKINDPPTIFQVLIDIVKGLELLHRAGYVHRDISPENVLLVNSRGVLIDMEYAVKRDSLDPQDYNAWDPRLIGTIDFMSIEIQANCFEFLPMPDLNDGYPDYDYPEAVQFVHNPLHDIESVWWILVWVILWRAISFSAEEMDTKYLEVEPRAQAQYDLARKLFTGAVNNRDRDGIFKRPWGNFQDLSICSLKNLVDGTGKMGWVLHTAYQRAERSVLQGHLDTEAFLGIYAKCTQFLASLQDIYKGVVLCSVSGLYFQAKHAREKATARNTESQVKLRAQN